MLRIIFIIGGYLALRIINYGIQGKELVKMSLIIVINPWRACAERVTVVVLFYLQSKINSVLMVCIHIQSRLSLSSYDPDSIQIDFGCSVARPFYLGILSSILNISILLCICV